MSRRDVGDDALDSPLRARSLLTVRAAISFARFVDAPRSLALSLMWSYCRSRLLLHAFCGIERTSFVSPFASHVPFWSGFNRRMNARIGTKSAHAGACIRGRLAVGRRVDGTPHPGWGVKDGFLRRARQLRRRVSEVTRRVSGFERWVLDVVLGGVLVRQLVDDVEALAVGVVDLDEGIPLLGEGILR